jgi:alkanesulfonate monooxygenase SsuD/methylene tetrahydromethanopterin reductase-like flavin-dependent oxidoreductase (luciferase family)
VTPAQASSRFSEFVTVLDLLLTRQRTTWRGEWFSAVDARNIPGPVQKPRPPFIVAANGPKGIRLAVDRAEGWATMGTAGRDAEEEAWWAGAREAGARCDEALSAAGRSADSIARYLNLEVLSTSLTSIEHFRHLVGQAGELGFTDVVIAWPRPAGAFAGDERFLEDIAADLASARSCPKDHN